MIVDTMTYPEICEEFLRIHREFMPRYMQKIWVGTPFYNKIRKYMMKNKERSYVVFPPFSWHVDHNTTFYCAPQCVSYNVMKKMGLGGIPFLVFRHRSTLMAIEVSGFFSEHFKIYTQHFIDRYIERFLKTDISREEAFCHYIMYNRNSVYTDNPDKEGNMVGASNDVVVFADYDGKIMLLRTCITQKMLFESQTEYTDELKKLVLELNSDEKEFGESLSHRDMKKISSHFKKNRELRDNNRNR